MAVRLSEVGRSDNGVSSLVSCIQTMGVVLMDVTEHVFGAETCSHQS